MDAENIKEQNFMAMDLLSYYVWIIYQALIYIYTHTSP